MLARFILGLSLVITLSLLVVTAMYSTKGIGTVLYWRYHGDPAGGMFLVIAAVLAFLLWLTKRPGIE